MKNKSCLSGRLDTKGFTLIELLIVVLIIGILAAVALPQYQKSVEKSRAAQAMTMLKSVSQAIESYHLANGEWPQSFDELSIDIPWTGTEKYYDGGVLDDVRANGEWSIELGKGSNGSSYVMIGRLTGAYAGGGFYMSQDEPEKTLCIEGRESSTTPLNKSDGDYCIKLFHGYLEITRSLFRYYHLP